ncbi:hypothetical protein DPEC_G00303550, partial [Dallia pectoralis]
MSVPHFTGETMEIPNPTLVGLIRREPSLLPVRSQVLLFLCPQENTNQRGKLNVFLL